MTTVTVQGVEVPGLLYGTAWKEERTAGLVGAALAAGFRGIDTANQRRHYHEAAVGEALAAADALAPARRPFLQTKFTYVESQDRRLPFDPAADLPTQVRQSCESSLAHLRVERLDALLLHGPRAERGLSPDDEAVWHTLEALHGEGATRLVGASNVSAGQVELLCRRAAVPPAIVQNRCFARFGWDREVRAVCRAHGIAYQGFSLLTANAAEVASPTVRAIAARHGCTPAQAVLAFARRVGMVVLTGTTDPRHMREDLAVEGLPLADDEVAAIEALGDRGGRW